jgi:asparagine synthase (glutamine-hydrolysing)
MRLTLTQAQARQIIADLPWHYDEPFADSSQIPTLLVSKLTREHVTVALSGDGGDELFCGYQKYQQLAKWQMAWRVPAPLRKSVRQLARVMPNDRFRLAATGLALPDARGFAQYYTYMWRPHEVDRLVSYDGGRGWDSSLSFNYPAQQLSHADLLDQLMLDDLQHYLPNDILTKVDRASMAVSLEARVPLLDHRVVEFAMRLPLEFKWRGGKSKYILRKVLSRYLSEDLFTRPKHGFGIPLDHWLRNELRSLIVQYLDPARLTQTGLFDARVVQSQVERFLRGDCGHARVWSLLMFQMWQERFELDSLDVKTQ